MSFEIQLKGFDELARSLRTLPAKLARQELAKALREAAYPMLLEARRRAPVLAVPARQRRAGTLKRNVRMARYRLRGQGLSQGVTIGVRKLSAKNIARIRAKQGTAGARANDPFYWYFLERGWTPAGRRDQSKQRREWRAQEKKARGEIKRPFLAPAFAAKHAQFLATFKGRLTARLAALWRKEARGG